MHLERMKQLVRVLVDISMDLQKTRAFCLEDWIYVEDDDGAMYLNQLFEESEAKGESLTNVPHSCGTTACAAGYAGLDNWFRLEGFRTTADGAIIYDKANSRKQGWDAISAFFELDMKLTKRIFDAEAYAPNNNGPVHVLGRMIEVIQAVDPTYLKDVK